MGPSGVFTGNATQSMRNRRGRFGDSCIATATSFAIAKITDDIFKKLVHVGLLLEPVGMERYEFIRMPVRERWVAMMLSGVPLAKRKYVTARDLDDIPVIMPSRQKVHDEVASWFGDDYEKLRLIGTSNLSTNAALMVQAGMGYALAVEGSMPFLEQSNIRMIPLYPELTVTSVLAWKWGEPISTAVSRFLEYIKCFLSME